MPSVSDYLAAQPNAIAVQSGANTYANSLMDQAAKLQAGQSFSQGNFQGASADLASRGDFTNAEAVQKYGASQFQSQHEYIQRAIPIFQQIYQQSSQQGGPQAGAQAVAHAFDTISPDLKTLGVPDDTIAQYRTAISSDPVNTLQALNAVAARKFSYQKVGENALGVFDDNTGQMVGYHQGNQFITAGPGQKVINAGPDGATDATAPPGAPPAAPGSDALFGSQPVNPGAVQHVESGGNPNTVSSAGASGTMQTMPTTLTDPGFGVRPAQITPNMTPDQIAAEKQRVGTDYLGALQQHYGSPTLALVAYNMGPGATDAWVKNGANFNALPQETKEYLGRVAVAQATGQGMGQAMGAPNAGGVAQATVRQAAASPTPNPHVIYDGGPEYRAPTADELKQYPGATQINAATGEVKYPPMNAVGIGMTADQLQPLVDIVKAGGTLPTRAMSNPLVYSNILQAAKNQGVDTSQFLANQANRKATQTTFQNINTRYAAVQTQEEAFQNSLNYAYQLAQKAGPQGGGTLINGFKNYLKTGVVGDPATGAFINAVNTAMNEYGKIIEGSTGNAGSSISARADAASMLSAADNLPAFVAKMQALQQDASYKIGALKDQHDTLLQTLGSIGAAPGAGSGPGAQSPKVIRYDAKGSRIQ
jgi:hypothetical protein